MDQEDLDGFLTLAQELKVKGLENKETYVNEISAVQKVETDFVKVETDNKGFNITKVDTMYADNTIADMKTINTLEKPEDISHEGTIVNDLMERKDGLWVP